MQNSRESSVLRSLAVAFGDGLAFGVGMKLSQRAAAAPGPASAPPAHRDPLLERLSEIERRLAEVEHAPPSRTLAAGAAPFDQKVLEAVVTALDARLNEQAARTESRLNEMKAGLAIELKSLGQQDHAVATGIQTHLENLTTHFNGQIAELRRRAEEEREAIRGEMASMHREFAEAAAKAFENRVEEVASRHIGLLRAELEHRDRQIAEMRRHADEERDAIRSEMTTMHRERVTEAAMAIENRAEEISTRHAGLLNLELEVLHRRADEEREAIRGEMASMHSEFAEEAARAVENRVEEVVARHANLLRAELEFRDDQIAELREVIFGFAQACRTVTERPAPRVKPETEQANVQVLTDRRVG